MKKLLFLFVIMLLAKGASAQIDSIGKGMSPRLIRWYEPASALDTAEVDSSVYMRGYETHRYNDVWKHDRVGLGNLGSESFSLYPERGSDYFYDSRMYRPFYHRQGTSGFYNTTMAFTRAFYALGPNEEQKLDLLHTQNVNERLNVTANMKRVSSDGFYPNHDAAIYAFGFSTNYFSKDQRYVLHAEAGMNSTNNRHNNGITDLSFFTENLQPNRQGIAVHSQQAYMEADDKFFHAYQTYKLTDPELDSGQVRKFNIELRNRTRMGSAGSRFVDDNPDPQAYSPYGEISPSAWIESEQRYDFVENTAEVAFDYDFIEVSGYYFMHSGNFYFPTGGDNLSFADQALGGTARLSPFQDVNLNYDARTYFLGFNQGGLKSDLNVDIPVEKLDMELKLRHLFDRNRGFLNYYRFNSNAGVSWENDFNFMNQNLFSGNLTYKEMFRAKAEYWNTGNAVFFGSDGRPQQDGAQRVLSMGGGFKVKFGNFVFDLNASYNKSFTEENFRIPEIISKSSIYFQSMLFSDKLEMKTGFDVFYLSPYRGNGFSPLTRAHYIQDEYTMDHMVYPNFFMDVRIHNTKIFLKGSNVASGMLGHSYMPVPGHPMQDFVFRFGLAWDFWN